MVFFTNIIRYISIYFGSRSTALEGEDIGESVAPIYTNPYLLPSEMSTRRRTSPAETDNPSENQPDVLRRRHDTPPLSYGWDSVDTGLPSERVKIIVFAYTDPCRLLPEMSATSGAILPPELFADVIRHLSTDFYDRGYDDSLPNERIRGCGVLNGMLVCMWWARQCRERLFRGRTIRIKSMKQAIGFRNLVMGPCCGRLTRIADMVGFVDVWHFLDRDARSWFQIVGVLIPRLPPTKLHRFIVQGPRSKLPDACRLRNPFWGVGRLLPHFVRPYRRLELFFLRFVSPEDIICFVNHFTNLEELEIWGLTWDEASMNHSNLPQTVIYTNPRRCSLRSIHVTRCTDGLLLWRLVSFGTKTHTALQLLLPDDQQTILNLVEGAYAMYVDTGEESRDIQYEKTGAGKCNAEPSALWKMTTCTDYSTPFIIGIELGYITLHLLCDYERSNPSAHVQLRVIGCVVALHCEDKERCAEWAKLPFWAYILQFSSLRGLVVGLPDEDALKSWFTEVDPALRDPGNRQLWYHRLVTFEKHKAPEGQWMGRDPSSLDLTGMSTPYRLVRISSCTPLISTLYI